MENQIKIEDHASSQAQIVDVAQGQPQRVESEAPVGPANPDQFRKFILACLWDKRITKHELILMDILSNVYTLKKSIEDEKISLNQALKIVSGLPKIYTRIIK